ncbi:MAG TPA: RDD family protein [Flavisolibacter sp.]|nr:RDD family protein [Flavisolibacter sp.]
MERYFTFWRRLGAILFDSFFLGIISYSILSNIAPYYSSANLIWTALSIIITILYNVLLTGLYGQTIGKIIMGIKVLDVGEQHVIGIKRAIYRESIYIFVEILGLGILIYEVITNGAATQISESVEGVLETTTFLWGALELATMLFNPRRRALHDFLASSVVISLRGQRFDQHYEQLERQRTG